MSQLNPTLSSIFVYPVKSAKGISVVAWNVDDRGLELDRRWMIVDNEYRFLTQRKIPRLALISPKIENERLLLNAPGMESAYVELNKKTGKRVLVRVWDDTVESIEEDATLTTWISDFLHVPSKLVLMPEQSRRFVKAKYAIGPEHLGFADAFPFHILSEGSVEELNSRLETPLPINRFRPNLVISGCRPFEEDEWKELQIGTVRLHVAKPCSRCVTTTVDQSTGVAGKEPLRTLATFREKNGEVYFGQNAIHRRTGRIAVGDPVHVLGERVLPTI